MSEPQKDKAEAEELTEQEQEALNKLDAISHINSPMKDDLIDVVTAMGVFLYPLEAYLQIQSGNNSINSKYQDAIAAKAAKELGADEAEVKNPETRTAEQQQAMTDIAGKIAAKYLTDFENCNYMLAKDILKKERTKYDNRGKKGLYNIKSAAALYFFATHPDILPDAADTLKEEHKAELLRILQSLDDFYIKQTKSGEIQEAGSIKRPLLYDYIEANAPHPEETTEQTKLITKKIQEIEYPLDKVNTKLWGLMPNKEATLKAESDNSAEQANIYLMLEFENIKGLSISRPLTFYDKKVFLSVCNLKEQGNDIVTVNQIYRAMGNKSNPNLADKEKILKSIEVMSAARVSIDNTEEAQLYPKYDKVNMRFNLLNTIVLKGYKNRHIIEDAIKIEQSPLFIFSKNRNQITTAPIALLESPISQTEANLQLEDYLLRRIAQMKNKAEISKTIKLETVYNNCDVTTSKQKARLPEKITRILDHYKKIQWIKGYTMNDTNIKISL